ncbi:MAG: alkaline phosphatase D family protein [Steroidobacteraceae bacterium]
MATSRAWAVGLRFERDPFSLGVASGYPSADGFVLWTRLAPEPLSPNGGMDPVTVPVVWEVASDSNMRNVVRCGVAYAAPDWAHSVHVEVDYLEAGRPYWYRFTAGDARSPIGRAVTAPPVNAPVERLRLALASCQNYEHGYFVAYERMLQDAPDLVVHVGDYIYETGSCKQPSVRQHGSGEANTLDDYRTRYALYKSDPNLQAIHAACPWVVTWDDHEVDNDYAGDVSEHDDDPVLFLQRRTAAYRAYYEHMPLPRKAVPFGNVMRVHLQQTYGDLVNLCMLDGRQYRTPQACPQPGRRGSNHMVDCAERLDATRTMLGQYQEAWLRMRLCESKARWNLLAQGVVMAHLDELPGEGERYSTDSWNGYPAARQRLIDSLVQTRASNPVILSGDIHAFAASDISRVPERADTPIVTSELVTTSISTDTAPERRFERLKLENPNTKLITGLYRGYTRLDITPKQLRADLIAMDTVSKPHSDSRVLRSFTLEAGRPGLLES